MKKSIFLQRLVTVAFMMITLLGSGTMVVGRASASVDSQADVCNGIGVASAGATNSCGQGTGVTSLLRVIINILSFIVGAVSIIMIIIGGLRYVTSGGNDQNMAGAKNTIIFALIGMAVVAVAQVLVEYVFTSAKSATR